jgi:predicted nucleotidyltransferase
MLERFSNSAEVRFIDYDQTLADVRRAVAQFKAAHPEIAKVYLFGSLVRGDWTADSDADLIVVVRREFADILERAEYHISVPSIPTDTVVYSEAEFETLAQDPHSFLSRNLSAALEL